MPIVVLRIQNRTILPRLVTLEALGVSPTGEPMTVGPGSEAPDRASAQNLKKAVFKGFSHFDEQMVRMIAPVVIRDLISEIKEVYAYIREAKTDFNDQEPRHVSNYLVRLEKLQESVKNSEAKRIIAICKEFDAENAIEAYVIDLTIIDMQKQAVAEKQGQEREELKNLEKKKMQHLLMANAKAKNTAQNSRPHYSAEGSRIDNMVCVVVDLVSGELEDGRAGHGTSHQEFEELLGKHLQKKLTISKIPVGSSVSNTVNCAEWAALKKILTKRPSIRLRGSKSEYSDLYFVSAVPGHYGRLIPPCKNCQRLMNFLNALAFNYTPSFRNSSNVE